MSWLEISSFSNLANEVKHEDQGDFDDNSSFSSTSDKDEKNRKNISRNKKKRKKKSSKIKESDKALRKSHRHRSPSRKKNVNKYQPNLPTEDDNDIFFECLKGNKDNFVFGSLPPSEVSKYACGKNDFIGIKMKKSRLDPNIVKDAHIVSKPQRYYDNSLSAVNIRDIRCKRLQLAEEPKRIKRIETNKHLTSLSSSSTSSSSTIAGDEKVLSMIPLPTSFEVNPTMNQTNNDDDDDDNETSVIRSDMEGIEEVNLSRSWAFGLALKTYPNLVPLWLAFADHSAKVGVSTLSYSSSSSSITNAIGINKNKTFLKDLKKKENQHMLIEERRLSVLRKAMQQQPLLSNNIELLLAKLNAACKCLSLEEMDKEWQNSLNNYGNAIIYYYSIHKSKETNSKQVHHKHSLPSYQSLSMLWCKYHCWQRSCFKSTEFTYDIARLHIIKSFQHFAEISAQIKTNKRNHFSSSSSSSSSLSFLEEKEEEDKDFGTIELLYSACLFEFSCGYHERGIALLQAFIDFSLCFPKTLKKDNNDDQNNHINIKTENDILNNENEIRLMDTFENGFILPFNERLKLFEEYWESEAPRFSECSSHEQCGWNYWDHLPQRITNPLSNKSIHNEEKEEEDYFSKNYSKTKQYVINYHLKLKEKKKAESLRKETELKARVLFEEDEKRREIEKNSLKEVAKAQALADGLFSASWARDRNDTKKNDFLSYIPPSSQPTYQQTSYHQAIPPPSNAEPMFPGKFLAHLPPPPPAPSKSTNQVISQTSKPSSGIAQPRGMKGRRKKTAADFFDVSSNVLTTETTIDVGKGLVSDIASSSSVADPPLQPVSSSVVDLPIQPISSSVVDPPIQPVSSSVVDPPIQPASSSVAEPPIQPISSSVVDPPILPASSSVVDLPIQLQPATLAEVEEEDNIADSAEEGDANQNEKVGNETMIVGEEVNEELPQTVELNSNIQPDQDVPMFKPEKVSTSLPPPLSEITRRDKEKTNSQIAIINDHKYNELVSDTDALLGLQPIPSKESYDKTTRLLMSTVSTNDQLKKDNLRKLNDENKINDKQKDLQTIQATENSVYSLTHGYRIPINVNQQYKDIGAKPYEQILTDLKGGAVGDEEEDVEIGNNDGIVNENKKLSKRVLTILDDLPKKVDINNDPLSKWANQEMQQSQIEWKPLHTIIFQTDDASSEYGCNKLEASESSHDTIRNDDDDRKSRSVEEEAEESPHRVVMFDDIKPYFEALMLTNKKKDEKNNENITNHSDDLMFDHSIELKSMKAKRRLVKKYLHILGLSFPRNEVSSNSLFTIENPQMLSSYISSFSGCLQNSCSNITTSDVVHFSNLFDHQFISNVLDSPLLSNNTIKKKKMDKQEIEDKELSNDDEIKFHDKQSQGVVELIEQKKNSMTSSLADYVLQQKALRFKEKNMQNYEEVKELGKGYQCHEKALAALNLANSPCVLQHQLDPQRHQWIQSTLSFLTSSSFSSNKNDQIQCIVYQIHLMTAIALSTSAIDNEKTKSNIFQKTREKVINLIQTSFPSQEDQNAQLLGWNAYASLEFSFGNLSTCRKVLHRTLKAACSSSSSSSMLGDQKIQAPRYELIQLFHSSIRLALCLPLEQCHNAFINEIDPQKSSSSFLQEKNDNDVDNSFIDLDEALSLVVGAALQEYQSIQLINQFKKTTSSNNSKKKKKKKKNLNDENDENNNDELNIEDTSGNEMPPTLIIKARNIFNQLLNLETSSMDFISSIWFLNSSSSTQKEEEEEMVFESNSSYIHFVYCFAVFEYLTNKGSIHHANIQFENAIQLLLKQNKQSTTSTSNSTSNSFSTNLIIEKQISNNQTAKFINKKKRREKIGIEFLNELEIGIQIKNQILCEGLSNYSKSILISIERIQILQIEFYLWHLKIYKKKYFINNHSNLISNIKYNNIIKQSNSIILKNLTNPGIVGATQELRQIILKSLKLFPKNICFLSCLLLSEMNHHDGNQVITAELSKHGASLHQNSAILFKVVGLNTFTSSPASSSSFGLKSQSFNAYSGGGFGLVKSHSDSSPLPWLCLISYHMMRWLREVERMVDDLQQCEDISTPLSSTICLKSKKRKLDHVDQVEQDRNHIGDPEEEAEEDSSDDMNLEWSMFPDESHRVALTSALNSASVNRLRYLFESAILELQPSGRVPPLIWRLYARFEASCNKWGSARRVLLRALSSCPWSKDILLDAVSLHNSFQHGESTTFSLHRKTSPSWSKYGLRRAFDVKELVQLLETAQDFGLCLRIDLPDVDVN